MSTTEHLLFVGLPMSGKTTFLAALWHVLDAQSSPTKLKLTKLSGDRNYLNRITEAWRSCTEVERTTMQTDEVVSLHLNGDGLGEFELAVPDLSGEAFELQIAERRISVHHDELVQKATGVMLFIHPDNVKKGTRISLGDDWAVSIGGAAQAPVNTATGALVPWSVESVPTQVKLVELLQFILERTLRKVRVALIVSAWDLIDKQPFTPLDVVSRHLPLLHQFLAANGDQMEHEVFGVSAQGGDVTVDEQKNALLEIDALDRIRVRQGSEESHDITRPLAWLLGAK